MGDQDKSLIRRIRDGVSGLLPTGGIGDESPAPDIDGRRDTDKAHDEAVLRAKSQMSPSGQGTTSYESVDRGPKQS